MPDEVFGMSREGARRTAETNRRVLGRRVDTGRRTRRVYPPGGGGGGGTQTIAFSINAADCVTGAAIGTVLAIDCTNSSVKIGDTVDLLDFLLCFLTGNETLLLGRKGYASWMEDNNTNMSNYGCRWHITSLCKIDFGC